MLAGTARRVAQFTTESARNMIAFASAVVAVLASSAAFVSAFYWLKSSRVVGMAGGVEPGDEIAALHWHAAGARYGQLESSALNAKAARWGAVAAILYGLSGLIAAVPVIVGWVQGFAP